MVVYSDQVHVFPRHMSSCCYRWQLLHVARVTGCCRGWIFRKLTWSRTTCAFQFYRPAASQSEESFHCKHIWLQHFISKFSRFPHRLEQLDVVWEGAAPFPSPHKFSFLSVQGKKHVCDRQLIWVGMNESQTEIHLHIWMGLLIVRFTPYLFLSDELWCWGAGGGGGGSLMCNLRFHINVKVVDILWSDFIDTL